MFDEPECIGDWLRERNLGSGAFGVVTLWHNPKTNQKAAIKKYRGDPTNSLTAKQKERWAKEVEMMQRIDCVNIVNYQKLPSNFMQELEKYNPSKLPMLSMEYCAQGDLRIILSQGENCCGLPESDVRYILSDLMHAVSYLHSLKITHRDLKPENIVLQTCDRPNKIMYKLIDLGYAKEIDAASVAASFVGTMQYLAPEFFYSKTYSCSVDYWSLGLVAFEVICGTRPFLPNMSPAQWIRHVKDKKSEDICVYQKLDKKIKYSTEIFAENHISSCFKREIEQWLQLALEFSPKKRGYLNYDPQRTDNELVMFTNLEKILQKKILTVFSVYSCLFLSYEIDDFTLLSTVQGWIERDTKVLKSEQFLLSYKCEKLNMDGLAMQCFDETYTSLPMLYVYKKATFLKDEIIPEIPYLVKSMLENAGTLPYYFLRTSYAHALYLTYKENNYYNTILDACSLKIKYMISHFQELHRSCTTMMTNIHALRAQRNFSKEILDFDVKQYLKNFSQDADHWVDSFTLISNEIEKLFELSTRLCIRFDSAYRRIGLIAKESEKEYSKYTQHALDDGLNDALNLYREVKRKKREIEDERIKSEGCMNMVKVLYKVLKNRDILLKANGFTQYQQKILDIERELEKMSVPINTALQHIEKIKSELQNDHITRQTKIWEFTIKPKPKTTEQTMNSCQSLENIRKEEPKANFKIGGESLTEVDYGTPISLDKPLHFILGDSSNSKEDLFSEIIENNVKENHILDVKKSVKEKENDEPISEIKNIKSNDVIKSKKNSNELSNNLKASINSQRKIVPDFQIGAPASIIINDNKTLRYELQEKTDESFLKCKSILSENLDFSFLEIS